MRITKRLTEKEFNDATAQMRFKEKNRAVAKTVLVDGFRAQEVAEQLNVPKQVVSRTVHRIWRRYLELLNVPTGWVSLRVLLPPEEAEKVLALEAELRAKNLFKEKNR